MPREIRGRRKEGFSIPMKNWLTAELRPMMEDVLSPIRMSQGGLFNSEYVERMKSEHVAGIANHAHQLWSLMVFELWRDGYIRR